MPSGRLVSHGRARHHRPPPPQPLDRLYNWCSRCDNHWDQAMRPACVCYPGTESWRIRFLSSIPYFDMAHCRPNSGTPRLKFDEPMLPPVEPGTRRKPNMADWTWEVPSPLLQPLNDIPPQISTTSPHSLDPYEYYSSPTRDSKRYSQWQPPPTFHPSPPPPPPPKSPYQLQEAARRRHSKIGPQRVSQLYSKPYDSGYGSSSSNGIPPPSALILPPGVQVIAQRPTEVPFMYRKRDSLSSRNHR